MGSRLATYSACTPPPSSLHFLASSAYWPLQPFEMKNHQTRKEPTVETRSARSADRKSTRTRKGKKDGASKKKKNHGRKTSKKIAGRRKQDSKKKDKSSDSKRKDKRQRKGKKKKSGRRRERKK